MKGILELVFVSAIVIVIIAGISYSCSVEHAYVKYGEDIFHNTPICPRLVDDLEAEYIKESGELVGSEEVSMEDAWNDVALDMCDYCFAKNEINNRLTHYIKAFGESGYIKAKELARLYKRKEIIEKYTKKVPKDSANHEKYRWIIECLDSCQREIDVLQNK